jgi:hypothetical protein
MSDRHAPARLFRIGGAWLTLDCAGAILLAGCSPASQEPGAVTADEAHQLNEAAAMLDANSIDANSIQDTAR